MKRNFFQRTAVLNYEISDLIEKYKSVDKSMGLLNRQFYEYMELTFDSEHNKIDNLTERYLGILHLTFPSFSLEADFSNHYFTELELILINNIAIAEHKNNEDKKIAIGILKRLKKVFEVQALDLFQKARHYSAIIANLTNWLAEINEYDEAYKLSLEGIEFCRKVGNFILLPHHLYDKGYFLILKGNKIEGRKYVLQSFRLMQILKQEDMLKTILENANKLLGSEYAISKNDLFDQNI